MKLSFSSIVRIVTILLLGNTLLHSQWAPVGSINVWTGSDPHIQNTDPDLYLDETGTGDSQFGIILREDVTSRGWLQFDPGSGDLKLHCAEDDIIFESSDAFGFDVDGEQKMVLTGAGRLGIGVGGPGELLHIKGTNTAIRLEGTNGSYLRFYDSGVQSGFLGIGNLGGEDITLKNQINTGNIEINSLNKVNFLSGNSHLVTIDNAGRIGIGTETPGNLMHISSSSSARLRMEAPNSKYITFFEGTTEKAFIGHNGIDLRIENNEALGDIEIDAEELLKFNTNDALRMLIDKTGNVGIGTSSPQEYLHIDGGSGTTNIRLESDDSRAYTFYEDGVHHGEMKHTGSDLSIENYLANGNVVLSSQDWINMYTQNTLRMVLTDEGKMGLGGSDPLDNVHINPVDEKAIIRLDGNLQKGISFYDGLSSKGAMMLNNGHLYLETYEPNGNVSISSDDGEINFQVGGNTYMLLDNEGKLSVGGANSLEALNVQGAVKLGNTGTTNAGTIRWTGSAFEGRTASAWKSLGSHWGVTGTDLHYETGDVGIGTDAPASTLHVHADGPGDGIRVTREGFAPIGEFSADGDIAAIGTVSNHDFRLISNNAVHLTVSKEGNIGINQINPSSKLHILGDARMNGVRLWTTADSSNGMIRYHESDFQGRTPDGWQSLTSGAWTSAPDSITHIAGKVGIGTDLPAYDLEVDGDVNITGELTSASDRRIKNSIKSIQNALHTISQLNPVSYNFNTAEFPSLQLSEKSQMGLLAQELQDVLPGLVSEGKEVDFGDETDALKSVNYVQLIPLLIQGMKEMKKKLDNKDAELEHYKALLHDLESRVLNIENQKELIVGKE